MYTKYNIYFLFENHTCMCIMHVCLLCILYIESVYVFYACDICMYCMGSMYLLCVFYVCTLCLSSMCVDGEREQGGAARNSVSHVPLLWLSRWFFYLHISVFPPRSQFLSNKMQPIFDLSFPMALVSTVVDPRRRLTCIRSLLLITMRSSWSVAQRGSFFSNSSYSREWYMLPN